MERQLTLAEVAQGAVDTLRASLYVSMPGAVIAYYPTTQTADVQPMVNDPRLDLDSGKILFEPWLPILQVPVMWPRFGGMTVCGFLEPNDQVILEAFDLDPGPWRRGGKSVKPVDPDDVRRLGGNYWRANPTDLTGPIASAPVAPGVVVGLDGGLAQLVITATGIQLGKTGGDHVALASKVDACMLAIKTHTHPGVTTGPGSSGPSAALSSLPPTGSALIAAQ